jgi:hypothetical protein
VVEPSSIDEATDYFTRGAHCLDVAEVALHAAAFGRDARADVLNAHAAQRPQRSEG